MPTDDFVQRIAIYLLNALSCQVDYSDKQLVGSLGAFPVMHICQHGQSVISVLSVIIIRIIIIQ